MLCHSFFYNCILPSVCIFSVDVCLPGERDLALDSAERIQKAYEDFQCHVRDRMQLAQQQIDSSASERDKLRSELASCHEELTCLRDKLQKATKDRSTESDARDQLEQLNADVRSELLRAGMQVADLESKLSNFESVQHENGNLRLTVEHQRVRLERCQAEIGESRAQLVQLEDLTQRLQQSMTVVQGNQGTVRASITPKQSPSIVNASINSVCSTEVPPVRFNDTAARVLVLESELQQARKEAEKMKNDLQTEKNEVQRLKVALASGTEQATGAVAEMADASARTVQELELSLARLEDEREGHMSTISNVESRVADLEARNAATAAELAQRGQQLEVARKELADYGSREAALYREIRKQALQTTSLERQLDEKVSEFAAQIKRTATLADEVQSLSSELRCAQEERDEQSRIAIENASACSQMRQLHDAQCREMEASIASLNEQNSVNEASLRESHARAMELQKNLMEMTEQTNMLKQERSRREQEGLELTEILENRAVQAEELVSRLETELEGCRTECGKLRSQCNESNDELHLAQDKISKLNEMLENMSQVEMRLKTAVEEQKCRAAEMEESSEQDRRQLHETETKLTELECEQVRLLSQIAQCEHALQCKTAECKAEVETLQKKLNGACSELARRDDQMQELSSALRGVQLERSRTLEDLGGQLKVARRQLKQQSKIGDDLQAEVSHLKAELELSVAACEQKDARVTDLSERLASVEGRLESVSSERQELVSELERSKQSAKLEMAERLEVHDQEVTTLKAEVETVRANLRRCEDSLRSKEKEVEHLTSSLQVPAAF